MVYPGRIIGQLIEFVAAPGLNNMVKISEDMTYTWLQGNLQFEFWGKRKTAKFSKECLNKGKYFGKEVIIATGRDISDRKKNDEALLAAKVKAEASEKLKSAFWRICRMRFVLL